MTKEQLIQGWRADRFSSLITGRSEELGSEVHMRMVALDEANSLICGAAEVLIGIPL